MPMYGDVDRAPAPQEAKNAVASLNAVATTGDQSVALPSVCYMRLAADRALPRSLMGGTKAMRAMGEVFMPRHPAEAVATYQTRLLSTVLYGGFKDGVERQAAKFFEEPIELEDDVPTPLVDLCQNIDAQGRAVTPFAMDLVKEAMCDGISFILVDSPPVVAGATRADAQQAGVRPYWVLVKADDLIGWQTEAQGSVQALTQVRLRENVVLAEGKYGEREVQRIRVLEPGKYELYELRYDTVLEKMNWVLIESGLTSGKEIMVVPLYTNRSGYFEAHPPLQSLAEMNLEHWVSSSEQRRALTFLRFAMLAIIGGNKDDQIEVGPDKRINVDLGGDVKYVEHSGAGLDSGFADLDRIEKRMRSAGMTLRVEDAGQVTATATAVDSDDANAALRAIAKGLKDAIEQALQFTAELMGEAKGGTVTVFTDFANAEIPGSLQEMVSLRNGNCISLQTMWKELQRRGMLDEEFDPDVEMALIENEVSLLMGSISRPVLGQPPAGAPKDKAQPPAGPKNVSAPTS